MPARMTEEERNLIKLKWNMASDAIVQESPEIFLSFFEAHYVYQSYFHQFKEKSLQDLRKNPKLRDHGTKVINMLSSLIEHINDEEEFLSMCGKLASDHYPRGVRPSQYRELLGVVGDCLHKKLGGVFDIRSQAAWDSFVNYLVTSIRDVMDTYDPVEENSENTDEEEST